MKQIYSIMALFLITGLIKAQSLRYNYDAAGNRTGRAVAAAATARIINEENAPVPCEGGDRIGAASNHREPIVNSQLSIVNSPAAAAVDRSKGVGEIPISGDVRNGAAIYTVPIELYPGRHGFQPQLTLTYNSMSGNGVAGHGWHLGGLSSIFPVSSTYYYDGTNAIPEKIGAGTPYAMDGTRLLRVTDTKFESEEGFIEANIYEGANRYYFNVNFPDGRAALYGNESHTKAQVAYPIAWMRDLAGNFINYKYEVSNNTHNITEISYGCDNQVIGKVLFTYANRNDISQGYRAGSEIRQQKLLTRIQVYHQSTLLRTYTLTHLYKEYNFLKSIRCKIGDTELNPLTFKYDIETDQLNK